jgi:hypothetical protein
MTADATAPRGTDYGPMPWGLKWSEPSFQDHARAARAAVEAVTGIPDSFRWVNDPCGMQVNLEWLRST